MHWRLRYVIRTHGITDTEPLWRDTEQFANIADVESDEEAARKAQYVLEGVLRRNLYLREYQLVRVVVEEQIVSVVIPRVRTKTEQLQLKR